MTYEIFTACAGNTLTANCNDNKVRTYDQCDDVLRSMVGKKVLVTYADIDGISLEVIG